MRALTIVIEVEPIGGIGERARASPPRRKVDSIFTEQAERVGFGDAARYVVGCTKVVFGNGKLGTRVVGGNVAFYTRDQLYRIIPLCNPAIFPRGGIIRRIAVACVPKRARGLDTRSGILRRARLDTSAVARGFAVVMQIDNVEQALARRL